MLPAEFAATSRTAPLKSEAELWKYLRVTGAIGTFGHVCRVETHSTALGQPDLNVCFDGVESNIELKHVAAVRMKKGIVVRPSQYRWFRARIKAGGNPWFIVGFESGVVSGVKEFWLVNGAIALEEPNASIEYWKMFACKRWQKHINMRELVEIIKNDKA